MSRDSNEIASALWIVAPGKAEIRRTAAPNPDAGSLRIRGLVSGISRGTESLVFNGKIPESEWQLMRCPFQEGEFPFPVKYGYAMVGVVETGPAEKIGHRVFCLHPHQSRFTIPAEAAFAIPAEVSTERAVLVPQIETALNATWDAAPRIGDRIAVVGAGVIGCLVAYLCSGILETAVTLIDTDEDRRDVAKVLGLAFATPSKGLPSGCDLVFHASGQAEGLDLGLSIAGFEATVIELSWYGITPVSIGLGGAFHSQRLTLRSSQVGHVASDRRSRWSPRRRLALAVDLAADPRLDVLVREETPFEALPAKLPSILGQPGALCHLVRYPDHLVLHPKS